IVTNDKFYGAFEAWKKTFRCTKPVSIVNDKTLSNEKRLGAIGDIDFVVRQRSIADDLMVIAGDNLFDFSLAGFCSFFKNKKSTILAVHDLGDPAKLAKTFGTVQVDKNGRVISFEEKPEHPRSSLAATACYLFTKEDVAELRRCIEENRKPDNSGDFIGWLSKKKAVHAYRFKGRWFDIGSHEQYDEVNRIYSSKKHGSKEK
ncbi:nucleotidyltransferase family protein, partial [Candidatus Woesearchaeota archaeon]|nr:nucleotidyltransferase family protein [Candidatus Woesearchaeota archaeon]